MITFQYGRIFRCREPRHPSPTRLLPICEENNIFQNNTFHPIFSAPPFCREKISLEKYFYLIFHFVSGPVLPQKETKWFKRKKLCILGTYSQLREVVKKRIFYGQAGRKGWPSPPLRSAVREFFWCVHKKRCLVQKHCFKPLLVGQNFHICLRSGP